MCPSLAHASLVERFTTPTAASSGTCPSIAVDSREQDNDYLHIAVCIQSSTVTSVTCPTGFTQEYVSQANALTLLACKKAASSESGSYSPSWSGTCGAASSMLLTDVYETSGTAPAYDVSGTPATAASAGGITAPSIGTMAQSGESVYADFCTTSASGNGGSPQSSFIAYAFGNGTDEIGENFVGSSTTTLPKTPSVVGQAAKAWIAGDTAIKGVAGAAVMVSAQTPQDNSVAGTSVTLTPSGYAHAGDYQLADIVQDSNIGGAVTLPGDILLRTANSGFGTSPVFNTTGLGVVIGDMMVFTTVVGSANTFTPPAGWTTIPGCPDTQFGKYNVYYRVATSGDASGASYTFTTNANANWGYGIFFSVGGGTLSIDSNSTCGHVTGSNTAPVPQITTQTANELVLTGNNPWSSTNLTIPTGEVQYFRNVNASTGAYFYQATAAQIPVQNYTSTVSQNYSDVTIGIASTLAAASPFTSVLSVTDPTTTGSRTDLLIHKVGSNEPPTWTFSFPSAGSSSGQLLTVGNLDSTTPIVETATLGLPGAISFEFPLVTPTTADELCLFGMTKGIGGASGNGIISPTTVFQLIPSSFFGFGGGKTGNILAMAYGGIQTCQTVQQASFGNADPSTGFSIALKAATAPTHPTAIERVDQAYMIEMGAVGAAGGTASGEVIMP